MAGKKTTNTTGKIIRTTTKTEKEITMEVIEECFALPERDNGTVVRLDYAAWTGNDPRYELRIWKKKDGVMQATKGIGLSGEELIALRDALNEMEAE